MVVRTRQQNTGFTLLEMMVVLVLVSLITVLLMQGFSFVVGLQERIRQQLIQIQDSELREQWFRMVVRSFHRGRSSDDAAFHGDAKQLSGLVLQPLNKVAGMPTTISWKIEQVGTDYFLTYQEEQEVPVTIMRWATATPEFRYMDDKGNLNETWPPTTENTAFTFDPFQRLNTPILPKGVVLLDTSERTPLLWYVSISNNTPPEQ